jgi:signal transduction histidine kinase
MSLSVFIRDHHDEIIREFAVFARTLMPPGAAMSEAELRDHAEELLTAIALDMGAAQTPNEQSRKSRGLGTAQTMAASGRLHADDRIQHGFAIGAVLAEFRGLRATVLRLYEVSGSTDLAEVRRFNESVDEALTMSITRFTARTDLFRDQFIGVLSHDLRTPLGAMTTGAALLAVPEDNPQRRAKVAATILSSAQRMERMIADLLDLTQARLGGVIPLTRGRTDLQQVCEDVMREIRTAHRDVVLRLETSGNLVGDWDADRLAQVVSNLVGNAIQHGEGTPVTLVGREEGDRVTLAVHNGGSPIPPEAMPVIFEPLARGQADSVGVGHSIGLGLFIARAIVSAHGGEIHARSSSESGTTFTVLLPKGPLAGSGG